MRLCAARGGYARARPAQPKCLPRVREVARVFTVCSNDADSLRRSFVLMEEVYRSVYHPGEG